METREQVRKQINDRGHSMSRKFCWGLALSVALLVAGRVAGGQEPPPSPPAPRVAPEPPTPPEPPDSPEVFLLNNGAVHLGVAVGDVTPEKAVELKLPAIAGAIVESVQKDSAAAKAGLHTGDVIMEFDGTRVRSSMELRRLIRETPPGRTVAIKILRDGKSYTLSAKLEAASNGFSLNVPEVHVPPFNVPEIHIPPMDFSLFGDHRATLGIIGDDLTPQLAQYFGVKQGHGVLVSEVTTGGPADKAGLRAGDVIVQVDSKPVRGVEELRAALLDNFNNGTRQVSLTIVRDHHEQTVKAELAGSKEWEKSTSTAKGVNSSQEFAQALTQQSGQLRAEADHARAFANAQRALVQAEILNQRESLKGDWQRELQQQMLSLKDQLKKLQNLRLVVPQGGEI